MTLMILTLMASSSSPMRNGIRSIQRGLERLIECAGVGMRSGSWQRRSCTKIRSAWEISLIQMGCEEGLEGDVIPSLSYNSHKLLSRALNLRMG